MLKDKKMSKILNRELLPDFLTDDSVSDIENYVEHIVSNEANLIDWEYFYKTDRLYLSITYRHTEEETFESISGKDVVCEIGVPKTKNLDLIDSLFSFKSHK